MTSDWRGGGEWTEEKLGCIARYLKEYTKIFEKNARARYFRTTYVDAFAGSGKRDLAASPGASALLFDVADADYESFKKGSAHIALEVVPAFDQYLFIEANAERVASLRALARQHPSRERSVTVEQGDANRLLQAWCESTDWTKNRAVVFLDPFGAQVDWSTVETVAKTKAIDLWYLFPLGVAALRLLPRGAPPNPAWAGTLTRLFGTEVWRDEFYKSDSIETLFESVVEVTREASPERIGAFFVRRLQSIFARVAEKPRILRNSTNSPIYLLCFAAGNKRGAPIAVRIAQYLLADRT